MIEKINPKKIELYVNKLYRGELARYKKKLEKNRMFSITAFYREEGKIRRKSVSTAQQKTVLDTYKNKCVVCGKTYDKYDFEIHHVDGNRENTITKNLVPMCKRCHNKVTTRAKAKLRDYKIKHEKPRSPLYDIYKPPKFMIW